MKKAILWLDDNIEPILIYIAYAAMAGLVFEQVVLRFLFKTQVAWSAGVAIYMFIWVTWLGAAYNVRKRAHLTFGEIRAQMSYGMQFVCLIIDALMWVSLAVVVIYYALDQIDLLQMNFAFVPGTSNLMQWWFYLIMPFGWGLIILRAVQNLWQDIAAFRRREPFKLNAHAMAE
ncbi:TRAP transporter small permease [Marivibrio halodurans]|uniref:TRAP transporter small permease protein n=1 Tax=Marivibrio halodurans TaxID=2039722 RepID=A0A8J7V1N5_9PROT|nr:TRAP transporter small permease [Marivibrio halodurans]MBP5856530.1 TRAP transporter small permease [Marivibrio halodurans]